MATLTRLSVRCCVLMAMLSPSSTRAMGPPSYASGETWPIMMPEGVRQVTATVCVLYRGKRTMRCPTKSSICHQGNVLSKACPHQCCTGTQHLRHTWTGVCVCVCMYMNMCAYLLVTFPWVPHIVSPAHSRPSPVQCSGCGLISHSYIM